MIEKTKFLFFSLFLILFFTSNTFSKNNSTRFIAIGHLYPIMNEDQKLNKFANKINDYNPDYIFILGDSGLEDKKIFNKYKKIFKAKLFFSPGEQEIKKSSENYKKNVGYFNLLIEEKDSRFILLNSSEKLETVKKNLNNLLKNDFENGPTIILTNHRIWDDTLLSKKPLQHDKSYYFKDIYPLIKGKVDFIFAGNGKRQYFRDLEDRLNYGKQNVNVIHWLDKVGDINAYAVGMGDGEPKAIFTIVDVVDKELFVKGDYSTTQDYDILPKDLISPDKLRLSTKYTGGKYYFVNKKKLYISLGIAIILFGIFSIYRRLKK